jgi:hypothetical protein
MISVITISCREKGRLSEMAKTLVANARASKVKLEWIVVDEQFAKPHRRDFTKLVGKAIKLRHIKLPLSDLRKAGLPDHNRARNIGLAEAKGNYVVFLDDCYLVADGWAKAVADVAKAGKGFRPKMHSVNNLVLPPDALIKGLAHWDKFTPVKANTVAGPCWGAPKAAFDKIVGFDEAYCGQDKYHDLDACIRLGRAGVKFVTTERAFVVCLRSTKDHDDVTANKEAQGGHRNQKLYNDLVLDRSRIVPVKPAAPVVVEPPTPTPAPPPAAPPAAKPAAPKAPAPPAVPGPSNRGNHTGKRPPAPKPVK